MLPFYFFENEKQELLELNLKNFLNKISTIKNLEEELIFKNIVNLIILCLTLSHFNTNMEKYFSTII